MIPEWLLPYLPAISGVIGLLVSWALKSESQNKIIAWFNALKGWGKLGVLAGLGVLYGALIHFGLGQELVDGVYQIILFLLGTQVGYQTKPSGGSA